MKIIILTGATSFLGKNLVESLLNKNYLIYIFVRKNSKNSLNFKNNNIKYIYGSLDEIEIISNYINHADIFIHFAWAGSGSKGRSNEKIQMNNVDYSNRALELAIKLGCKKFIFSGSQAEYGKVQGLITETTECNPISFYGKAKLLFSKKANVRCKKESIEFIHLRIFSVYGYGDRQNTLVDLCINAFNKGNEIQLGSCSQLWNYIYISDFVNIIIILMESNCKTGTYNIASHETKILKDFVKIIYELSNKSGSYTFENEPADNPEGSPDLNPSINKLSKYINDYQFKSFKEGIRMMINEMEGINESISIKK